MLKRDLKKCCPVCNKFFTDPNYAKSKTCSLSCGQVFLFLRQERKVKHCEVCGEICKRNSYRTCSHSCSGKLKIVEGKSNMHQFKGIK